MKSNNIDPAEIEKFDAIAANWWNPNGEMELLHSLNPLRLKYIESWVALNNQAVLDVGCGGGILSESLACRGAHVTGIDLSDGCIEAAKSHAKKNNLEINYQLCSVEEMALNHPNEFDVITCMEMLEHVPNPVSIINACAQLLKPNGTLFFSTLNRNFKSFFYAIIGAEYLTKRLPRGTHHYAKFIRPSELTQWACEANLTLNDIIGIEYNILKSTFNLSPNVDVNYLAFYTK